MEEFDKLARSLVGSSKDNNPILDEMWTYSPFARKLNELGVTYEESKANLHVLLRAYDSMKTCDSCKGLDYCDAEMTHCEIQLIREDGYLKVRSGTCLKFRKIDGVRSNLSPNDAPEEWLTMDEDMSSDRMKSLLGPVFTSLRTPGRKNWIYVTGDTGSGKSFVAFQAAKTLASNWYDQLVKEGKIAFLDTRKRFEQLRGYGFKQKDLFDSELETYKTVKVLFLDNFGDEYISDYSRDSILMPILQARASAKLFTCIISSYSLDEIRTRYSTNASARMVANKMRSMIDNNLVKTVRISERFEI